MQDEKVTFTRKEICTLLYQGTMTILASSKYEILGSDVDDERLDALCFDALEMARAVLLEAMTKAEGLL